MTRVIGPKGKNLTIGYHTQSHYPHKPILTAPIKCNATDAWLGFGYYFWFDKLFAHYWGLDFKLEDARKNLNIGSEGYSIYVAKLDLDPEHTLDTTFNEVHYKLFVGSLKKVITTLQKGDSTAVVPIAAVHTLLAEVWTEEGKKAIIYDDLPSQKSRNNKMASSDFTIETETVIDNYSYIVLKEKHNPDFFCYRKRVQVVIFDLSLVTNFNFVDSYEAKKIYKR